MSLLGVWIKVLHKDIIFEFFSLKKMNFVCVGMGIRVQYRQNPEEGVYLMGWKLTELSDTDAEKQLSSSNKGSWCF